jgi:hypothetical protein
MPPSGEPVLSGLGSAAESGFAPRFALSLGALDELQHLQLDYFSVMPNALMRGAGTGGAEVSAPLAAYVTSEGQGLVFTSRLTVGIANGEMAHRLPRHALNIRGSLPIAGSM